MKLKTAVGDSEYRIHIDLQLQKGFGKGVSSLANVTLNPASNPAANMHSNRQETCSLCSPTITFEKPSNQIFLAGIVEDGQYLMTSEYVKLMCRVIERGRIWLTYGNRGWILVDGGLLPNQDFKWQCSAGMFVGTNEGSSIIYLTPKESELSKSPVTIELEEEEDDGRKHTAASRRFWLLRKPSGMHC